MQDDWLGKLAFMHYWRLLEEQCPGVVQAPEFAHMSLVERQAWIEAARAVREHVRASSPLVSSK